MGSDDSAVSLLFYIFIVITKSANYEAYHIMSNLSREQQTKLNNMKVKIRMENEKYIRQHPELRALMDDLLDSGEQRVLIQNN